MSEHTKTFAVQLDLVIGLAGDEGEPIPTDPEQLKLVLAENIHNWMHAATSDGKHFETLAECITNVQTIAVDDKDITPPEPKVIPFRLPLENGDTPGSVGGRVEIGSLGVEVFIDGHGMKTMEPGYGSIVYVNHFDGSPQVVVHGDILQEDPTHVIQLATAAEERRETDGREPLFNSETRMDHGGRRITYHTFKPNDADGS